MLVGKVGYFYYKTTKLIYNLVDKKPTTKLTEIFMLLKNICIRIYTVNLNNDDVKIC